MSNFIRQRGFLDASRLLHAPTFNNRAPEASNLSGTNLNGNMIGNGNEMSSNTQILWGTNINTNDLQAKLKEFLTTYTIVNDEDQDLNMQEDANLYQEPHYITLLKQISETEEYTLDIDCDHIFQFNRSLYRQLEDYPTDVIPIFDLVAVQVYKEYIVNYNQNDYGQGSHVEMDQNEQIIQVRPFNLRKIYQIRELDPSHIDKLITLKGIVIRTSDTTPEMKEATFRCTKCQREECKYIERGKITEPENCENCNGRFTFEMMHNLCMFSDKQHIKMQETPESVPEGETPQTLAMCAYEDLVDYVKPGDRVEVVGIYRAIGQRLMAGQRILKNIYKTYVDVIGYTKTDKRRYENDNVDVPKQAEDQQMEDGENLDDDE
jgi:DNA replication licensing factor MCM4